MNKNLINHEIQAAYDALRESKIVDENDGSIKKTYRGQISSFGAAITMGSLISSVAFFSADGGSEVERSKLMKAILLVLKKERGGYLITILYDFAALFSMSHSTWKTGRYNLVPHPRCTESKSTF